MLSGARLFEEFILEDPRPTGARPTPAQHSWLRRGLDQPSGKLPLFDREGKRISPQVVRACIDAGWATPWFANPLKPDWLVCRLTEAGRLAAARRVPANENGPAPVRRRPGVRS